jgi:uncharacterized repeat protein (TIGR03803 family)
MSYWKMVCLGFALFAAMGIAASAQTFTTLTTFLGPATFPYSATVQGTDGNFYGTTGGGGSYVCDPNNGCGTVFKVTPSGTLTTLHTFCTQANCPDGSYPYPGLVLSTDGNFYGATGAGGAHSKGTVFKITPDGKLTTIHSFCVLTNCTDGAGSSTLIQASDGNFYGIGGAGAHDWGTVFKITPQGKLTTLYTFCSQRFCVDGSDPRAGLVRGNDGDLYGTTYSGGIFGAGTVFKLAPNGTLTTLHSFGSRDGTNPSAGLVQDSNGNFYGSTEWGGSVMYVCSKGCGTLFEITATGAFTTLERFDWSDGYDPYSAMIQGTDGNLYGTTVWGLCCGVVFNVTPKGEFTLLFAFNGGIQGADPIGGLLQSTNGIFYGTTAGEFDTSSTIYSLDMGLGPFISFVQATGKTGATAQILGQGLTGATSVTFNGVAAAKFSVVSDTYMTAVVPAGATTGSVVVATPAGNLTSNVSFRISK